jgi:hypothetical protein
MLKLVPLLYNGLLLLSFGYVARWGRWPERAGLLVIIIGSIATALAGQSRLWAATEVGILAVDVAVLLAFVAILGLTNRFWPLWVTAFQLVSVTTHLARFLKPATVPLAYAFAEQIWAYAMIAVILASVRYQWRRTPAPTPAS